MGELATLLNELTVQAWSTDGEIEGVLRCRGDITLQFDPEALHRYREADLESQLSQLFTTLWSGWDQGYRSAIADRGMTLMSESDTDDAARLRFLRDRDGLVGSGSAADGDVRAKTRGGHEWKFKFTPGILAALDADEFTETVLTATARATADRDAKLEALKRECFDHPIATSSR